MRTRDPAVLVLSPIDFLAALARLIPPPRVNRHRYHGVLAPDAALRERVTAPAPSRGGRCIRREHLFAEAKNEHGLARARRRGAARIQTQMPLTGIVQNLKRLSQFVGRKPSNQQWPL